MDSDYSGDGRMNEFIQILEEQGYDSHWDAGQGILVIDNAKQSEFKRIRKILEKAKYKGSFSVPGKKGEKHDKDKRKERESLSRYSRVGFREGNEV